MPNIVYTPYKAFDWKVHKAECPNGHSFIVTTTKAGPRTEAANIALYTQGLLTGESLTDSLPVLDRPAGTFSQNLNPIRQGQFKFTAVGNTQWWCINYIANQQQLPNVIPVVILAGTIQSFPLGTRLFLCEGTATVNGQAVITPTCLQANTNPIEVVASSNVYGFVFLD
jgi:hypothetical protein